MPKLYNSLNIGEVSAPKILKCVMRFLEDGAVIQTRCQLFGDHLWCNVYFYCHSDWRGYTAILFSDIFYILLPLSCSQSASSVKKITAGGEVSPVYPSDEGVNLKMAIQPTAWMQEHCSSGEKMVT